LAAVWGNRKFFWWGFPSKNAWNKHCLSSAVPFNGGLRVLALLKILKSDIAVGEFWRTSGERMITSNCIALRAKSFETRHTVCESAGLLLQFSQIIEILFHVNK